MQQPHISFDCVIVSKKETGSNPCPGFNKMSCVWVFLNCSLRIKRITPLDSIQAAEQSPLQWNPFWGLMKNKKGKEKRKRIYTTTGKHHHAYWVCRIPCSCHQPAKPQLANPAGKIGAVARYSSFSLVWKWGTGNPPPLSMISPLLLPGNHVTAAATQQRL